MYACWYVCMDVGMHVCMLVCLSVVMYMRMLLWMYVSRYVCQSGHSLLAVIFLVQPIFGPKNTDLAKCDQKIVSLEPNIV